LFSQLSNDAYDWEIDVTWADVKRQMALEDHLEVEAGTLEAVEGNITPSAFIVAALELEEVQ
jgi:hypothetical protein